MKQQDVNRGRGGYNEVVIDGKTMSYSNCHGAADRLLTTVFARCGSGHLDGALAQHGPGGVYAARVQSGLSQARHGRAPRVPGRNWPEG